MDSNIHKTTSVTKFNIEGQNLYIRFTWVDDESNLFVIKIYDAVNSWSGALSAKVARSLAESAEESIDVYKTNTRQLLSCPSKDYLLKFTISDVDNNKSHFRWIKVYEDFSEMPYGSVVLNRDEKEPNNSLIDFLLDENHKLRDDIKSYSRRITSLTEDLEKHKQELEEFVNNKISLESSLYGKFVQLLNEKKKRIQLLEELIPKLE